MLKKREKKSHTQTKQNQTQQWKTVRFSLFLYTSSSNVKSNIRFSFERLLFSQLQRFHLSTGCEPDVRISFDRNQTKDISGNNYQIYNENVRVFNGAGYFNGKARLLIEPFRPSANDEGVLIVKLRYKARYACQYKFV